MLSPARQPPALVSSARYPATAFVIFLITSRRFPADTAPATWEYEHPDLPHSPKYMKSMHCPRPPMPTSDISSFWDRMIVYISTPGFRARRAVMMDTISGIGVGFNHFPPTISGATRDAAADPVSVDIVDADPPLPWLPPRPPPPALPVRDTTAATDGAGRPKSM
ncbi:hypothetical protein MHU86_8254 [Fragilaria crotonensis]|nr:hypothetical protein MHU86_8254 [Fragilaria crotonensis]